MDDVSAKAKEYTVKAENEWSLYNSLYDYNCYAVDTLPKNADYNYHPPLTLKQCILLQKYGWTGHSEYFYTTNTTKSEGFEIMKVPIETVSKIHNDLKFDVECKPYKLQPGEYYIPNNIFIYMNYFYMYNAVKAKKL